MVPYFAAVDALAIAVILVQVGIFLANLQLKEFRSVFSILWVAICLTSITVSACDLTQAVGNFEPQVRDNIQGAQFIGINVGAVTYAVTIYLRARADITINVIVPQILFGLVCGSGFVSGIIVFLGSQSIVPQIYVFLAEIAFGICLVAFDYSTLFRVLYRDCVWPVPRGL